MTTTTDKRTLTPMRETDSTKRVSIGVWGDDGKSATLWLRRERDGNWPSASIQCQYDGTITMSTKREVWEEVYEALRLALGKDD